LIRLSVKDHGFAGIYYPGQKGTDKIILFVGGAACNETVSVRASTFIRHAGYSVLVLGFYLWDDTPKELLGIPVEYVERACGWLNRNYHPRKIIMTGASTGGAFALLAASLVPGVNAVAAIVPFDYVMESATFIKRRHRSIYTWRGKDVPYTPFTTVDYGLPRLLRLVLRNKGYGFKRLLRFGYDQLEPEEEGRIHTEDIQGDLLLIGAHRDDCWPSEVAVRRIAKNLREKNFPYQVTVKVYNPGTHAMGGDYQEAPQYIQFLMHHLIKAETDNPKACDRARAQCEQEMLDFFENQ